ncbi:MAG: hypothetical protein JNM51_12935 [Bacteroidia bacterium]|nr:hypothetical protein [Bacteroidia bacterium]
MNSTKLFLPLLAVLFFSCKKDQKNTINQPSSVSSSSKTIKGKIQKGPYKNGSPITVYELNSSLGQTGRSFSSTISDDAGNFVLNSLELNSNYILLNANGYYYNEHFNKVSEGPLYLEAFADVTNISTVNVNILTHIIKPRIEHLVMAGSGFSNARMQAQNEFLNIVGSVNVNGDFETLDLSNNDFVFAMSLLFQRNNSVGYQGGYNYTAELSSLLSDFRSDFANNGLIDNSSLIDTLIYNVKRVDLIDTRNDIQAYYSGLGLTFSTANFQEYLYNFQKKYCSSFGNTILYPLMAAVMVDFPGSGPPYSERDNLLDLGRKYYSASPINQYVVSAIVPYDSSLVIKLTGPIGFFGGGNFGWAQTQQGSSVVLEAQRKNIPLSIFINSASDSVKIEYFKNNAATLPYFTKTAVFN